MQYEQRAPGDRIDLPEPSIDTGMGLERITAILARTTRSTCSRRDRGVGGGGRAGEGQHQASHRVIADHLRASSFLIAEGVLPSNSVGRGYVLRRIMRRAMRHAHLLGAKEPLMLRRAGAGAADGLHQELVRSRSSPRR